MAAELVADCPRCNSRKITFDVKSDVALGGANPQPRFEAFSVCRNCFRSTVFVLRVSDYHYKDYVVKNGPTALTGVTLNTFVDVDGFVNLADIAADKAPESLPAGLNAAYEEAARCLAVRCFNAAGTMFRLCIDMATSSMLPPAEEPNGPNHKTRRDLGLRLPWLFEQKLISEDLHDLSQCVREDGNDGAHKGTLSKEEALDLHDFTYALLDRIFTQPARVAAAKTRREERRNPPVV